MESPMSQEMLALGKQNLLAISQHLSDLGVERLDDKMLVASKICSLLAEVDCEAFAHGIERTKEGQERVIKMTSQCVAKVLQAFYVSLAKFDFEKMKADLAVAEKLEKDASGDADFLKDAPRPEASAPSPEPASAPAPAADAPTAPAAQTTTTTTEGN